MPLDAGRLLGYAVPAVRQVYGARESVLYALSVGVGQDPMDGRQLRYVDADQGLLALPSMAVVLGAPGFWLANPDTGVDAVRLVHGEQEIEWLAPLPVAGEVVGTTRVTGLVDKGAGKGALLYTEKTLRDGSGTVLAVTRQTLVLRGDGGFGGPSGPVREAAAAPEGVPDHVVDLATRPEQALLYRLNGDDNKLHADPAVAAAAGFARPILHGLCTLGVVAHALLRALADYDARRFRALQLRFTAPVFPGETIRTEIWRDGGFRARVIERDVVVVNNGRVTLEGQGC